MNSFCNQPTATPEKAQISDIKRFAVHDGAGIRTTVFFKGCPLRCLWCHNPESLSFQAQTAFFSEKCSSCGACRDLCDAVLFTDHQKQGVDAALCNHCGRCVSVCPNGAMKIYGTEYTVDELLPLLLEDRAFYGSTGGVTLSGGECLAQGEFCEALLRRLKSEGIHTAVDTCGCVPTETVRRVMPYTDVFLYDIKAIRVDVHRACTGVDNTLILKNFNYLCEHGATIEVRIPFVPNCNDGEMPAIAGYLSEKRGITGIKVLPYHRFSASRYAALGMKDTEPDLLPTDEDIKRAKAPFAALGLPLIG